MLAIKIWSQAKASIAALVYDFEHVALCKANNKSELGIHAAIANDYFQLADRAGKKLDLDATIHEVNSRPRSSLGWRFPSEVAQELLAASEAHARQLGRTLIVLDTSATGNAIGLYQRGGYTRAGAIPRFANNPDGSLIDTVIYYKELTPAP